MSKRNPGVWGTVKLHGTGKRVAAHWNGKRVYSRMCEPSEPYGGIAYCTWPEVWTFKPNDADWLDKLTNTTKESK